MNEKIAKLKQEKLLEQHEQNIKLTLKGMALEYEIVLTLLS